MPENKWALIEHDVSLYVDKPLKPVYGQEW